jgi:hypothetical protein
MLDKDQTQDMLEQAVYQQLFCGENRIMGKNPANTMQLSGVDKLFDKFISELKDNLELITNKKLKNFLDIFENRFSLSLKGVKTRIETNLEGMGDLEGQEIVMIYMVLTKLLEALRETSYNKFGNQRIIDSYELQSKKKFTNKIKEKIQKLAALNEENISLLYNLSFVGLLAASYNLGNLSKTVKRLLSTRINRIIKKIS